MIGWFRHIIWYTWPPSKVTDCFSREPVITCRFAKFRFAHQHFDQKCYCIWINMIIKWIGFYATFVHIYAKLGQENLLMMVRWMRWHLIRCRHMIRNSIPSGLRPSTLHLGHESSPQYWIFTRERGRNFCFFEICMPERGTNSRSPTFQAGNFNHCPPPPSLYLASESSDIIKKYYWRF